MSASSTFRDQVIAATGLSSMFAASVLDRACKRAGVDASALTPGGLASALDSLEIALKLYLQPDELTSRMAALRSLAARRSPATTREFDRKKRSAHPSAPLQSAGPRGDHASTNVTEEKSCPL